MSDESLDLFEEQFWSEVEELATKLGVSTRYVEEEFIIELAFTNPPLPPPNDFIFLLEDSLRKTLLTFFLKF